MDARGKSNGVLIPHSLRLEMISVHCQPDAVRVEDKDPQLRHVHSVGDLMPEYAELVLVLAIHAARRDISDGTALREIPG